MKIIIKFILALVLFIAVEKLIRTQTDGFRIEKTWGCYPQREEWALENQEPIDPLLNQEFHFLGSGVQCYVFIGDDNETVLKVFKHHHFGLTSRQLENLPLPKFLHHFRNKILNDREKRMRSIFSSALIAKKELPKQTGVFHLNLNPTEDKYPSIVIYDKIHIKHALDLNATPFLLQKKADLLFPYLSTHKEEVKSVIDSFFACITNRSKLGIANTDPVVHKNFGILDGQVIEIDVGSFVENPYVEHSLFSKRELFYQTLELKEWLLKNAPELYDEFEKTLLQAIRT